MLFGPKILEEVDSKFSGKIRVISGFGYKYIATGILTQSGGLVRDVWEPVIKTLNSQFSTLNSCLILGLAGGTIASMVAKSWHGIKITGVEIDPVMIRLGKKYLDLDKIPNLKIIVADAQQYVLDLDLRLDLILVDMYIGDQLPAFIYSPKFLKRLRLLSPHVIFNHLFYDDHKRQKAGELVEKLKQIFPSVTLMRKLTNLLIICDQKKV
jgi:hypothetical protein